MIRVGRGILIVGVLILLFIIPSIFSYRRESQPNEPCKLQYSTTLQIYIYQKVINININTIQIPEKTCLTIHFFGYVYNLNVTSKWLVLDGKISKNVQTHQIASPSKLEDISFDPPEYHTDFTIIFNTISYNSTVSIDVRVGKGSVYYDIINFAYYIFLAGLIRNVIVKRFTINEMRI